VAQSLKNVAAPTPGAAIAAVRGFNRFYTRQLGLLERGLLGSDFTLTEARVLYELAHRKASTASEIGKDLGLDLGYLSRVLKKFERRHLIERSRSSSDGRRQRLKLTRKGRDAFDPLNRAAKAQIAGMIDPMTQDQRRELVEAMWKAQRLLRPDEASAPSYHLRSLRTGDIGWIIHRQAVLYAQEYGWDETYEHLITDILANFVRDSDPDAERAWVAEAGQKIVGSVFLVRGSATLARLRLLYVEPDARGLGIGRHLVRECINFARIRGYRKLSLWTNDVLSSARRIYEAAGFALIKEEHHHSFGKNLVGQTWELSL
jgi:DNA-binding MarR family transcriptional regulator/GNAT superfamily N-acetyltransferase